MTTTTYRDEFVAANGLRVSVELCQGVWHTFARNCNEEPTVAPHASREAAREHARVAVGICR